MRKKHDVLLDSTGGPEGGSWNYDTQNCRGWRNTQEIPQRPAVTIDPIAADVLELVAREFPDNPADLSRFYLGITPAQAEEHFNWFLQHALARFGTNQDALAEESPYLFHSLVSMYLNIGLLDPLQVCRQVESAWRDGHCELADAEGFIRQVLGWRAYVRGIYWLMMPEYAQRRRGEGGHPQLGERRTCPAGTGSSALSGGMSGVLGTLVWSLSHDDPRRSNCHYSKAETRHLG